MNGFPILGSRGPMEESRPFPRLSSPPDSNASSPTPSSLESYGERELGVHPSEKVFNFPASSSADSGGPVTLTSLTPISPSNEEIHSAEQYRNPLIPSISRLSGAGGPFFTYLHQPVVNNIFQIDEENEKYKKMYQKKQKRRTRGEKNVITVMNAEDIDGHKTQDSIDSILESIGEHVVEDKKPKGKKSKEKADRLKPPRKDKRKSLEDTDNRGTDNEEVEEEEEELETDGAVSAVKFPENFYVLSSPNPQASKSGENVLEESVSSSPQSNFTKVTSKKSRARRGKEEGGRQSAGALQEVQRTGLRAREFDRDKNKAEKKDSKASRDERRESGPGLDKETFPRLVKDDFPALPGGTESVPSVGAGAWGRPAKASDKTPDNTDNEEDQDSVACDDAAAVIIPEVPDDAVSSEELHDSDNNNNNNACDEKIEVVTCPEEFERKEANKDSPVVIFSEEADQAWASSEFTFGFDVNEELMAAANNGTQPVKAKVEVSPQEIFLPFPPVGPIDSVDGAILDFGVAPAALRPLIVGVPVGVPVPASSFPLYSNHIVQAFPPYTGLTYPHHLPEQDLKAEEQEEAAVSPESGISSSSPLSWQASCSPLHSQVTESLNNWSGHFSETSETEHDSGLASCHSAKAENKFNFVEIVNFVSSSWSSASEDNELQVFSSATGAT